MFSDENTTFSEVFRDLLSYFSLSVSYSEAVGWNLSATNTQFMSLSVFIPAGECARWDKENRCTTPDEKFLNCVEFLWAAGIIPFKMYLYVCQNSIIVNSLLNNKLNVLGK